MDVESLRKTLALVCKREPSLLLDILDSSQDTNPTQHMTTAPSWCTCSFCRTMPTMQENVCCGKTPQNCHSQLAVSYQPNDIHTEQLMKCIYGNNKVLSLQDFYTIVLDELVLEVAIRSRNDALAEPRDIDYNKAHRHAAYRQYVMWIHGHLGAGNRKVIPSCCVLRIRDRYPDPSGHYIGYIEGVLGF